MPKETLSKIGIDIEDEKIAIDLEKTKDFFTNIQQHIENTAQNIGEGIKDGSLDMSENIGVTLDDKKIEIDMKQTKNFMESIGFKIEHFLDSLEHSFSELKPKK